MIYLHLKLNTFFHCLVLLSLHLIAWKYLCKLSWQSDQLLHYPISLCACESFCITVINCVFTEQLKEFPDYTFKQGVFFDFAQVKGGALTFRRWIRGRSIFCSKLLTSRAKSRYLFLGYLVMLHLLVVLCLTGVL